MNLDRELRRALTREDPPPGFDRRVLTLIAGTGTARNMASRASWRRFVLPVTASLVLALAGTYFVQVREQQRTREELMAAERATSEVALALSIASEKVAAVKKKVWEFNQHDHSIQP
jgi:hypothetical protein